MEKNHYDILLAQEANVSFRHQKIREYTRKHLSMDYHITSSETEYQFTNINKAGGTFVISNQKLKSHITDKIIDRAGRWAGNVYRFKHEMKFAMISLYHISNRQTPGETTARAQQVSWLLKNNRRIDLGSLPTRFVHRPTRSKRETYINNSVRRF